MPLPTPKKRHEVPHLYYPRMNQTRIHNSHNFGGGGSTPTFGNASRDFDGASDYISLPTTPFNLGTNDFSLAAWVDVEDGFDEIVIGAYDARAGGSSDTGITVHSYGVHARCGSHLIQYNPNVISASPGVWNHIVVTFDRDGNGIVYTDGTARVTEDISSASADAIAPASASIGSRGDGTVPVTGRLADVRVYDRILSASDVSDLYSGAGVTSGLIGWWLLDADDVLDYSGEGNDGTNNGSTYSTDGPFD